LTRQKLYFISLLALEILLYYYLVYMTTYIVLRKIITIIYIFFREL
jgi:hypothetical protein